MTDHPQVTVTLDRSDAALLALGSISSASDHREYAEADMRLVSALRTALQEDEGEGSGAKFSEDLDRWRPRDGSDFEGSDFEYCNDYGIWVGTADAEVPLTVRAAFHAHPHDQEAPQVSSGDGAELLAAVEAHMAEMDMRALKLGRDRDDIDNDLYNVAARIRERTGSPSPPPSTLTGDGRERLKRLIEDQEDRCACDPELDGRCDACRDADLLRTLAGKEQR